MIDFAVLDRWLRTLEPVFLEVVRAEKLRTIAPEYWRQDIPSVTVAWADDDQHMMRSIAYVITDDEAPQRVEVKVDAWADDGIRRCWEHLDVGWLSLPTDPGSASAIERQFEDLVRTAFERLRRIRRDDLSREAKISMLPAAAGIYGANC